MLKLSAESLIYEQFYSIKIIILIRVDRAKCTMGYVRKSVTHCHNTNSTIFTFSKE